MTVAEILQALRALPAEERRALALALLRDNVPANAEGTSPVDTSHRWPIFTAPLAQEHQTDALDHRQIREGRIDEFVELSLHAHRL